MNKGDLIIEIFGEEAIGRVDTAIPLSWSERVRELGIDTNWFVWSYVGKNARIHGEPINLLEAYFKKFGKTPKPTV
jgi:hypothetical protein